MKRLLFLLLALSAGLAQAGDLIFSTATWHPNAESEWNAITPGISYRTNGYEVGVYRNSLKNDVTYNVPTKLYSVYVGRHFSTPIPSTTLMVLIVSGYNASVIPAAAFSVRTSAYTEVIVIPGIGTTPSAISLRLLF